MRILVAVLLLLTANATLAQTTRIAFDNTDFVVTPAFNNVPLFSFEIEINRPLEPGVYDDPELVRVVYTVTGDLNNTPSGFPAFDLRREISGTEFYDQGSSLRFEVDANAVLTDGVQVAELSGTGTDIVFTFNGREIDNGRFHPALLELRADGTGLLQNSNNVISSSPLQQVDFGEEYITELRFDAGNLTVMTAVDPPQNDPPALVSGSGALSPLLLLFILAVGAGLWLRRIRLS